MINDELSHLFASDPNTPTPVSLRQGVMQAWDVSTGDNEVLVAGSVLVNIPVLTSEAASLAVGDVVSLASAGDKWLLLGRVTTPGDPGTVPSWPGDLIALTSTVTTLSTVTIPAVQADVLVAQGTADSAATTATSAASGAAAAQAAATAAQADADALQAALDTAEADIATAQADIAAILPITTTDISDDAITTPKIAANAVTAAEIAAGTITATEIAAGAITATQLSATAIDGKTITGTLFRTAASGQRLEIAPSASLTRIRGYTGDASETNPGSVNFGSGLGTSVVSPNFGTGEARIDLSPDTGPAFTPKVTISTPSGGDFVLANAGATIGGDVIATLTASQTLTNKDLTASTNTFPGRMLTQVLSAAMTGGAVTVPTTEADITGASVTFSTAKTNARYAVTASFYFGANTGGSGIATGKLSIDGTNQAAQANFTGVTTLDRGNVAQSWTGTLAASGSHTFKLRHVMTGTGTFAANPTHTALTVQIFE